MIVVDTNVLTYLLLPTSQTARAEALLSQDPVWAAPLLWRSEFRSVLAGYMRRKALTVDQAWQLQAEAESLLSGNEYAVDSRQVLDLVRQCDCSAYDCEFAALALDLNVRLFTADKQLLRAFPEQARALDSL